MAHTNRRLERGGPLHSQVHDIPIVGHLIHRLNVGQPERGALVVHRCGHGGLADGLVHVLAVEPQLVGRQSALELPLPDAAVFRRIPVQVGLVAQGGPQQPELRGQVQADRLRLLVVADGPAIASQVPFEEGLAAGLRQPEHIRVQRLGACSGPHPPDEHGSDVRVESHHLNGLGPVLGVDPDVDLTVPEEVLDTCHEVRLILMQRP